MNLFLIGFQRTGKSLYGAQLAQSLARPFIDSDQLIIEHEYKTIQQNEKIYDIHLRLGEKAFRELEMALILNLRCQNSIIALGGGTVLNPKAMAYCKQHGVIVYLKMAQDKVFQNLTTGRIPTYLSSENLEKTFIAMYRSRLPLYAQYADYVLDITNLEPVLILKQLKEYISKTVKLS